MSSYRSVHYDQLKVSPSGPTTAQFHHAQLLVSSIMTYYRQFYHGLPPQHILSWPGSSVMTRKGQGEFSNGLLQVNLITPSYWLVPAWPTTAQFHNFFAQLQPVPACPTTDPFPCPVTGQFHQDQLQASYTIIYRMSVPHAEVKTSFIIPVYRSVPSCPRSGQFSHAQQQVSSVMITYNRVHETERSALKNEAKEKYNF